MREKLWIAPELLDDDLAGHDRMDRAEVVVRARVRKRERELIVRVERLGPELLVWADHGVRHVVMIDPRNRRAGGHSDFLRRKAKVIDRNARGGILFLRRSGYVASVNHGRRCDHSQQSCAQENISYESFHWLFPFFQDRCGLPTRQR